MMAWMDLAIVTLLPLCALLTVIQTHPYVALVSRGIMGAVAVLLYAVLGAPDVALTEALVGTLLTIVLYAIAVRSSLVLRLGTTANAEQRNDVTAIRHFCTQYDLTLQKKFFASDKELINALYEGRIDIVHAPVKILRAFVPYLEDLSEAQGVTVLAPHGQWHEKKMKALFKEGEVVVRLIPISEGGCG